MLSPSAPWPLQSLSDTDVVASAFAALKSTVETDAAALALAGPAAAAAAGQPEQLPAALQKLPSTDSRAALAAAYEAVVAAAAAGDRPARVASLRAALQRELERDYEHAAGFMYLGDFDGAAAAAGRTRGLIVLDANVARSFGNLLAALPGGSQDQAGSDGARGSQGIAADLLGAAELAHRALPAQVAATADVSGNKALHTRIITGTDMAGTVDDKAPAVLKSVRKIGDSEQSKQLAGAMNSGMAAAKDQAEALGNAARNGLGSSVVNAVGDLASAKMAAAAPVLNALGSAATVAGAGVGPAIAVVAMIANIMELWSLVGAASRAQEDGARLSGIATERAGVERRNGLFATCRLFQMLQDALAQLLAIPTDSLLAAAQAAVAAQGQGAGAQAAALRFDAAQLLGLGKLPLPPALKVRVAITLLVRLCKVLTPVYARVGSLFKDGGVCKEKLEVEWGLTSTGDESAPIDTARPSAQVMADAVSRQRLPPASNAVAAPAAAAAAPAYASMRLPSRESCEAAVAAAAAAQPTRPSPACTHDIYDVILARTEDAPLLEQVGFKPAGAAGDADIAPANPALLPPWLAPKMAPLTQLAGELNADMTAAAAAAAAGKPVPAFSVTTGYWSKETVSYSRRLYILRYADLAAKAQHAESIHKLSTRTEEKNAWRPWGTYYASLQRPVTDIMLTLRDRAADVKLSAGLEADLPDAGYSMLVFRDLAGELGKASDGSALSEKALLRRLGNALLHSSTRGDWLTRSTLESASLRAGRADGPRVYAHITRGGATPLQDVLLLPFQRVKKSHKDAPDRTVLKFVTEVARAAAEEAQEKANEEWKAAAKAGTLPQQQEPQGGEVQGPARIVEDTGAKLRRANAMPLPRTIGASGSAQPTPSASPTAGAGASLDSGTFTASGSGSTHHGLWNLPPVVPPRSDAYTVAANARDGGSRWLVARSAGIDATARGLVAPLGCKVTDYVTEK